MSENRISTMKPSVTRTTDGKKIDSWRVELPDGHDDITVAMHATHDGIHFVAKGKHPCLTGLEWQGSDLAVMRQTVMEDVEKAAKRYFETDWDPGLAVEVQLYNRTHKEAMRVQLEVSITDLFTDPTKPVGNQGETHVLKESRPMIMLQRSHDQKFESDNSLSSSNMRYSQERGVIASRTIVKEDLRSQAIAFTKTLEDFSIQLMRRTAPDVVRTEGLPSPEDLALILREAIDNPETEVLDNSDPVFE